MVRGVYRRRRRAYDRYDQAKQAYERAGTGEALNLAQELYEPYQQAWHAAHGPAPDAHGAAEKTGNKEAAVGGGVLELGTPVTPTALALYGHQKVPVDAVYVFTVEGIVKFL